MEEHCGAGKGGGGVLSWDESKREGIVLVLQTRPNQPQHSFLSVSHTRRNLLFIFSFVFRK